MATHELSTSGASSTGKSSEDRETRARLLYAAARLFAERGYARVTVRDICKKARANVAAVNYHFGGKDGLYRAVMGRQAGTIRGLTFRAIEALRRQLGGARDR